jgi:hypothetical protein
MEENFFRTIPDAQWSLVHKRCLTHNGCIVDLGCLWWDWSKFFFGKKNIIGVDPQENPINGAQLFKGALANFTGKGILDGTGQSAKLIPSNEGFDTLTWNDFIMNYKINDISILKVNIEGEEYNLIKSFSKEDFNKIDQIAISFHHFVNGSWWSQTMECLKIIEENNFEIKDLGIWGWYLCIKKHTT